MRTIVAFTYLVIVVGAIFIVAERPDKKYVFAFVVASVGTVLWLADCAFNNLSLFGTPDKISSALDKDVDKDVKEPQA